MQPVPPHYVTKVKNTFFDALYFLLDGMVRLSFQDYEPLQDPMKTKMLVYLGGGNVPLPDLHRIETRTLLTISNFGHLKSDALPAMLRTFETTFGVVTDEDRRTLAEVEDQLDKILFDDFIRRKAVVLQRTIQRGITSGIDWYRAGKPTGAPSPARPGTEHRLTRAIPPPVAQRSAPTCTKSCSLWSKSMPRSAGCRNPCSVGRSARCSRRRPGSRSTASARSNASGWVACSR
jgi:hypothetical protein